MLFVLVNKRITLRLFAKYSEEIYINPGPGTVLDTTLVDDDGPTIFDFYLNSHKATIATARPVHYKVIHNTTSLSKE